MSPDISLRPVGRVRSPLVDLAAAPRQGDEGAPAAWIDVEPAQVAALDGIAVGHRLVVLTWLDRADRTVVVTHPRDDPSRPAIGVFATRSPDRPNPIGLHEVHVLEVGPTGVRVADLEVVDGTPVLDLKPVLGPPRTR